MRSRRVARDERGQSMSVFVVAVSAALILVAGLVIDGGQKVAASSRAESAAAGAARAAGNAGATQALAGRTSAGSAVTAAKAYLAGQKDVNGSVSVAAGVVTVRTQSSSPTIFLSVIGIDRVRADGFAQANIVATGERR
jgi:Flp pilus assembly protein TadG